MPIFFLFFFYKNKSLICFFSKCPNFYLFSKKSNLKPSIMIFDGFLIHELLFLLLWKHTYADHFCWVRSSWRNNHHYTAHSKSWCILRLSITWINRHMVITTLNMLLIKYKQYCKLYTHAILSSITVDKPREQK